MSDCNYIFKGPGGIEGQSYCKEHARWEVECLRVKVADGEKHEEEAKGIIRAFMSAFRNYEMDVDTSPPGEHKAMMSRATSFLE